MMRHKTESEHKVKLDCKTYLEDSPLPEGERAFAMSESSFSSKARCGVEEPLARNSFTDVIGASTTGGLRVSQDKHGLPVIYDVATHEQREQAKSDAISILSHELLSPLTIIKGYTSTLLQLDHAINEEQKKQYLRGIESASNRLIHLVEDLLDTTQLEETEVVATQPVYLYDLLRATISEIQSQTTQHVIMLRRLTRLPRIKVNPEKIIQVMNNLLTNAIKYSPQGGDIQVEVRMVQSELEVERLFGDTPSMRLPCVIVSTADSGIGIPEAELDAIFKKFYRVNTELTRNILGLGLGLHICKIIVEAHGGRIWVRNRLRGGSVFHFCLPME